MSKKFDILYFQHYCLWPYWPKNLLSLFSLTSKSGSLRRTWVYFGGMAAKLQRHRFEAKLWNQRLRNSSNKTDWFESSNLVFEDQFGRVDGVRLMKFFLRRGAKDLINKCLAEMEKEKETKEGEKMFQLENCFFRRYCFFFFTVRQIFWSILMRSARQRRR